MHRDIKVTSSTFDPLNKLSFNTLLRFSASLYLKIPKNSDIRKMCWNHPKIWTRWLYHMVRAARPNDTDRMATNVDPDQTAVRSGCTLFALTCPSKNSVLWYYHFWFKHTLFDLLTRIHVNRHINTQTYKMGFERKLSAYWVYLPK